MIGNEFERLRRQILINQGAVGEPSYLVLTDDTVIYFELANTPIANFATAGAATTQVTVNGSSITKNMIKEIVFGTSYASVTAINNYFLYNFSFLISVDLSPFTLVKSIGTHSLRWCSSLTSVDLSAFTSLISVGNYFMMQPKVLTSVIIGSADFSGVTIGVNCFSGVSNVSTRKVYAATSTLGANFKTAFTNLSNWTVVVQ